MSIIISCLKKFHAFALAEQISDKNQSLIFFTTYAYQKNSLLRKIVKRVDKEKIPKEKIKTNFFIAFLVKFLKNQFILVELYDIWVSLNLRFLKKIDVFIGWSSMSYRSIKIAKEKGALIILERGSSHILFQKKILQEEYKKFGLKFYFDNNIVKKELKEYELADYISIPSQFVMNSFLEQGISKDKLFLNPYGASTFFKRNEVDRKNKRFKIVYLGTSCIRKGVHYLLESVQNLNIDKNNYELLFIGKIEDEMKSIISSFNTSNCNFIGFINHYDLPTVLSTCDVAVHPSIEEGMSMVTLQLLACGVPVIATFNTGASEVVKDDYNGFIIDAKNPKQIKQKIEYLFENPNILANMKENAVKSIEDNFKWSDYGDRYYDFLQSKISVK
tara:strand:- start:19379 stop:20542 length:1164 start_codon:yes stop_codon:yes gene_type:complete